MNDVAFITYDGASSDDDLTPRIDAQAVGQDLGSSSAISCLPVSAVQEDAGAGLDELDLDDDGHMDVLSKLFDGAPPRDGDEDADLVVGAAVQVGVSGGAGGLGGGVGVGGRVAAATAEAKAEVTAAAMVAATVVEATAAEVTAVATAAAATAAGATVEGTAALPRLAENISSRTGS